MLNQRRVHAEKEKKQEEEEKQEEQEADVEWQVAQLRASLPERAASTQRQQQAQKAHETFREGFDEE